MERCKTRRQLWRASIGIAVAIAIGGCEGPSEIGSCGELSEAYRQDLAHICEGRTGSASQYCRKCAAAKLFSYTKIPDGPCICKELVLTDDQCAGSLDRDKLLAAILAADNECPSYQTPNERDGGGNMLADALSE